MDKSEALPKRAKLFGAIFSSWRSRLLAGVPIAAGAYQFLCDQFGFPTIPVLWGMTGAALPWWGWLLLAQLGAFYGLFEYVRLNVPVAQIANGARRSISTIQAQLDAKTSKMKPDVSLQEIGRRISAKVGNFPKYTKQQEQYWENCGLLVADKVMEGGLTVWGRSGSKAREELSHYLLQDATYDVVKGEINLPGTMSIITYRHVTLASAEIDHIWPPIEKIEGAA